MVYLKQYLGGGQANFVMKGKAPDRGTTCRQGVGMGGGHPPSLEDSNKNMEF